MSNADAKETHTPQPPRLTSCSFVDMFSDWPSCEWPAET